MNDLHLWLCAFLVRILLSNNLIYFKYACTRLQIREAGFKVSELFMQRMWSYRGWALRELCLVVKRAPYIIESAVSVF